MKNVSVCMATYNGEKYIGRQLRSILNQLSLDDEVIISDDHSTDRTKEIVESFDDNRIVFVENTEKRGPIGNFENALKLSTKEYIFLSDQDDVWLPNKVSTVVSLLEKFDLILSDCTVVDKDLNELYPSYFSLRRSHNGILRNIYKNSYMGCCIAFRSSVLTYALPFPTNIHMHDWWLGLITEIKGTVFFYESPLILYVRHGENVSPTGETSHGWFSKISNRITLVFSLLTRVIS
ncbi:glycosyltransferase family 2 protein [Spirosoma sp. RP8]|uniref:Glycosyltransferase family 2 protein n=1 Tax=Spirosoma liriopis TaxID=2937440 RepID=A0ABT0HJH4_9BACT|nr:glycosyltransferase family 2 protein [Spirosoma liriopis]MCK8492303.1 glycosyltransferase family 2 protein [Spirosoma liriopis]